MSDFRQIFDKCRTEFLTSCEYGDNKRKLVKTLQDLALQSFDQIELCSEIETFLNTLWNHTILLEDCILVSGIIFAKLNPRLNFDELREKAGIGSLHHDDWVSVALIRGALQNAVLVAQKEKLNELVCITMSAINSAISCNRTVLVSRNLENILDIFISELNCNCYDSISRGDQIMSIINRTLRLKSDLIDYKSRDLIKWHLSVLRSQDQNYEFQLNFTNYLLDCLPEMNKTSMQIYSALELTNPYIQNRIFEKCLPCLKIKGGLGSAAATCIASVLAHQNGSSSSLLHALLKEILSLQNSRDIIKTFKSILNAVDESVKLGILKNLQGNDLSIMDDLLFYLTQDNYGPDSFSKLEFLLSSGDEFIALEAFNLLVGESGKNCRRRKPSNVINSTELFLFQKFMNNVIFSGSVEFRQKVSVVAKCFYDQIYARIYHLIRELSKKPFEKAPNDEDGHVVIVAIDKGIINSELDFLFTWLRDFIKLSLVKPFNFCESSFGNVDFAFTQIIGIFTAFDGNVTLVAASPNILLNIKSRFRLDVVETALVPFADNFIKCVGNSTYDSLRVQAILILCKCQVKPDLVPVNDYIPALGHPRAINNEGAARIILLHNNLSKQLRLSSILKDIALIFNNLKADFPSSLNSNNINGRLLLLRFFIQECPDDHLMDEEISQIIELSMIISEFVSVIASHPSPEGLSLNSIQNSGENEEDDENDGEEEMEILTSNYTISGQYILSFSWRAIKETSSLLETLLKCFPSRMSKDQIHCISNRFISLLLKLRHCGAFRALQNPLSTSLRLGYNISEKLNLVKDVLEVCLGTSQITTTRRSAGLPYLILALSHSCSSRGNELGQLLENLISPLLSTARQSSDNYDLTPSIVHAFNIIRSLVRDSQIENEMSPYLAGIAELCLISFNSIHWSVRNASAMLLSSLISRLFGPNLVNTSNGRTHYVDLREIEVKFDGLIKVITSFLQVGIVDLDPRIAYPLLAILERVRIPPQERFEDFRSAVLLFLSDLLEKLDIHPENGRKLAHVLGRTVFSLLNSKSFSAKDIHEKVLLKVHKSTPNGIYNFLVVQENVKRFDSNFIIEDTLPPLHLGWHPILVEKYKFVSSHKSCEEANSHQYIGSPVLSSAERALEELSKKIPNIKLICSSLEIVENFPEKDIYKIIEKFPLNEEILSIALPILCKKPYDDRLGNLLSFYASVESNENIRLIALKALGSIKSLENAFQSVFALLLDDNDDIRREMCKILNPSKPLNLAETLKEYIAEVGNHKFVQFLDSYENSHKMKNSKIISLFEKEPLNLFIDIQFLRKQFSS